MTWIFLWSTTPNKVFIGDSQVSKIFVWDTQVRPTGGWWQPWPNTVLYFPLITDQTDHVGSSYIPVTWTTTAGVMGYSFVVNWNTSIVNAPASCIFMAYWIRANATLSSISGWPSLKWDLRFNFSHSASWWTNVFQSDTDGGWVSSTQQSVSIWTWYHMAMGYDGTYIKCYINGNNVWTYTWAPKTTSWMIGIWRSVNENVSELIWESACWTDAEVLNYFNQTKSNYGY